MAAEKVDTLIIGGGIIGLAIGYYLSERNYCNVEIIEREPELTLHASGHNAGGLSGTHPNQNPKLRQLSAESQKLYQKLAHLFDFDYQVAGSLIPGTKADEKTFEDITSGGKEHGVEASYLDTGDLFEKEPNLSRKRFTCALYFPRDAQGNSKKLGECFAKSCQNRGIRISKNCTAADFEISGGKVSEVKTTTRHAIRPENIVIAAGPWSREVSAKLGLEIPVSPVKGHLISIKKTERDQPLVNSFVSGPKYYVMQNGATAVVGGGEAFVGFDLSIDRKTIEDEWMEGISMVPRLEAFRNRAVSEIACLRPFAADGYPIIGKESKNFENVYLATGHFRSGFGLAPVTGKLISQLIIDGEPELDLGTFSPDRFLSPML